MSAPAGAEDIRGAADAARLMRALGAEAAPVWAQLTPQETHVISERMNALSAEDPQSDNATLESFLAELQSARPAATAADAAAGRWTRLTPQDVPLLAALVARESPQVAAFLLAQLDPRLAAMIVRMLDRPVSLAILQRILHFTPPPEEVARLIEARLEDRLRRLSAGASMDGHERVARIFDQLDSRAEQDLLSALDADAPGAGERVRALMFTFNDLAGFNAAAMQTLLAACDRAVLTVALKGARDDVANVFYSNLTRRAGALIREEMAALGPVRRSEVEAARSEIVETARSLIRSGDIRPGAAEAGAEDELVD